MKIGPAVLLVLVLTAASQPPSPTAGQGEGKPPQAPTAQEKQEAKPDIRGTDGAPLVVKVMDAPDASSKAAEDKKERDEHTAFERWVDDWIVGLTAGLVIVGIIQGVVLFYTAFISNKAANAAILAAQAAIGVELPALVVHTFAFANVDAIANPELRWWVLVHNPAVRIEIKNYGRTPAFVTSQAIEVRAGPLPDSPDYSRFARDLDAGTVIEGNGALYPVGIAMGKKTYSKEEVDEIREGRQILWAFGYVQYRDFLNRRHVLRFCREMIPLQSDNGAHRWIDSGPEKYSESF